MMSDFKKAVEDLEMAVSHFLEDPAVGEVPLNRARDAVFREHADALLTAEELDLLLEGVPHSGDETTCPHCIVRAKLILRTGK